MPSARAIERLPWFVRLLLGCCTAGVSVALTYSLGPLRAFPLLLAFPTVVLGSWFLGMWGGVACAVTDAALVDLFLTQTQFRFSFGSAPQILRLIVFLAISTSLGWTIRRLSEQRSELASRELQQRLDLADTQRLLAEERARASEALRERDEELQLALRANDLGLWVWDLNNGTAYWTDGVYRLMGLEPGSIEPKHEAWFGCIHPDDVDEVRAAVEQTRLGGKEYRRQYRILRADGSMRWIESQSSSQRDSEGNATRLVGVLADITPRKRAEDAMLRAEKLAVAGRLAASVAHEINNPLEAIANLLYLVTIAESTDEARDFAQRALEELLRVSLITQSTLKFHRQAGSPKLTMLSEVLNSVLILFRGKLLTAEIGLEVKAEHEMPVACMPSEVQQIFANLVGNAIDAMPRSGRLSIRLRPSFDWRDHRTEGMRVTFCDSGVGMDRATLRRISEPFFTTKLDTGTGLGMWVVAQLVERHHGHVRAWSRQRDVGSGTAISVFLPLASLQRNENGDPISELGPTHEIVSDLLM
jgi:PAS domain S-box-containing protein